MSRKNELPQQYIEFIKIIFQETYLQVQNNGYYSDCITLERGVRQGCPLSFPLYCTQNDVFTNSVNKDPNIKGFKLPGRKENLKLSQYAMILVSYPQTFQIYLLYSDSFLIIKQQRDVH